MNKLQKYINEIEKFLNEKYFCYPLKIQKYDYENNKNGTEAYAESLGFVINFIEQENIKKLFRR